MAIQSNPVDLKSLNIGDFEFCFERMSQKNLRCVVLHLRPGEIRHRAQIGLYPFHRLNRRNCEVLSALPGRLIRKLARWRLDLLKKTRTKKA